MNGEVALLAPAPSISAESQAVTVTPLDPTPALVVIDLQKGIVQLATAHPIDAVVKHASALADAFRRHHLPAAFPVPPPRA